MNHRQRVESVGTVSKPGRVVNPGQVQREPAAWLGSTRHKGGVTLHQALVWNVGTCRLDVKGEIQGATPKDEKPDARHRGGATRTSDEVGETRWSKGVASSSVS